MREEFEKCFREQHQPKFSEADLDCVLELNSVGEYCSVYVKGAWWAWQASRGALEIELPFLYPFYRQEVTEVLNAAGLRVKRC